MKTVENFLEYQILSASKGEKIESWNGVILRRPDPEIIWEDPNFKNYENMVDATYKRSNTGGGEWVCHTNKAKETFPIHYTDLTFNLKRMGFKHTGLFPEQAYNWNLIRTKIRKSSKPLKVLNLFAYTGGASLAALKEGGVVTHVDSSKGMIEWAKEHSLI